MRRPAPDTCCRVLHCSSGVPGMGFSPDKMPQGRLFAYNDAHRYRIGINYAQLPVNAPGTPVPATHQAEPAWPLGDAVVDRYSHRELEHNHYSQPRDLYRLMDEAQQRTLIDNLIAALQGVTKEGIVPRMLEHFRKVDGRLADKIASGLRY